MAAEVELEHCHEYPAHYKVMMDKLNEQRQLDQFTDITLIVDGHQFRAHKAVLAACSQFFHKFFQDFTQEPMVEIEGVSNSAFRHLMEFTYTATLAVAGEEDTFDVWKAAEYLQMEEAIKALDNKINNPNSLTSKNKGKKRKIAETSNVITETLPSAEGAQVEIEVMEDGAIEVETGLEEVFNTAKSSEEGSDDSALALLADITSKYQHGESTLHIIKKDGIDEEVVYQEEAIAASKVLENVEVVEVQISQEDNMFGCTKCDRSFKLYYHLKQHLKTHLGSLEKPHVCSHCGKAYTREGALKQHISTFHFDTEELSQNQKQQKKVHVCEYCKKHFGHFGHFKEHLRKHTGEKPYECPDCHEKFARNSTLKCHMAACQNGAGAKKGRKKVYECQVCSSVFNSWDQFKDHLVSHTGVKPYHCTMCDMWFTHTKDLRTHLKVVHSVEDSKSTEEVIITDAAASATLAIATQSIAGTETVLLDGGIQVEHVTVEPVDIMEIGGATTVVVEDEEVAEMCEEDVERLKQAGVQIQVVRVTTGEVEQTVVNSQVEVEVEEEMVNVEDAEQAVV